MSGPGDEVSADGKARARAKLNGVPEFWKVTADSYTEPLARQAMRAPTVKRRYLNVKHYAQNKNHWCGPAVGKMMLKNMNEGTSAWNGAYQWQVNIAKWAHMQTDHYGATRWAEGSFERGINRWRQGITNGWYLPIDSPSVPEFKNALRFTVQEHGWPFAADTVEWAYGAHYNNHPTYQKIGHWITVSAFGNYGDRTGFADPSTSVWPDVEPKFWANTKSFVNTYLQQNGIVW